MECRCASFDEDGRCGRVDDDTLHAHGGEGGKWRSIAIINMQSERYVQTPIT